MAKQKGILRFKGTLNGKCYYKLNGIDLVRKAAGPSIERITNDPAFANVKSNTQEFGGASKLSFAIRQGLANNAKLFKDTYMASRLTGCCRKIIQKGSGPLGQREANLHNNPTALIGFQLNKHLSFPQLYSIKPNITVNSTRNIITIAIAESTYKNLKKVPKTATHFQLTAVLSTVSNLLWQSSENNYIAQLPIQNGLGTTKQSQPLLCKIKHKNLDFQIYTPITNIPTNLAITVWLGITYFKKENNNYQVCLTDQAMQCIAVV